MSGASVAVLAAGGNFANFAGAQAERDNSGLPSSVNVIFNTDGTITSTGTGTAANTGIPCNWYLPTTTGIGSSFWVKSTLTSGVFTTDPSAGTWIALSAAQTWTRSASSGNLQTCTATFQISPNSSGTVILYTGSITFTANSV